MNISSFTYVDSSILIIAQTHDAVNIDKSIMGLCSKQNGGVNMDKTGHIHPSSYIVLKFVQWEQMTSERINSHSDCSCQYFLWFEIFRVMTDWMSREYPINTISIIIMKKSKLYEHISGSMSVVEMYEALFPWKCPVVLL